MSKGRLFTAVLACLMVFLTGRVTMGAETIYVHPAEGLYHTIADGVTAAAEGDTVMVAPGDWASFIVNKKVYIVSESGPDVTRITSGEAVTFNDPGDGASISGFTVTLSGIGIYVTTACDHVRIENNIISGCGLNGIYFSTVNSSINYCTISNNTISNNVGNGIYFYTHRSGGYTVTIHAQVINNIISNNNYGIIHESGGSYGSGISCSFSNNNLWNNTAGDTSGVTVDSSTGNIFTDPFFVNPETADYHLKAASPCIDSGAVGSVYNDPDGTRNNMGVYGGPGAAGFWPDPAGGPVVTELLVTPPSVPVGGTLTLKATGKIR